MSEQNRTAFSRDNVTLAALLSLLIVGALASLNTARHEVLLGNPNFSQAVAPSLALLGFIPLFIRARFGFGYLVGIAFYCVMIGFFFLTYLTSSRYDVVLARWSALASLLLFLLPVLFQTRALPRLLTLSRPVVDMVVLGLLGLALVVLVISAAYGFALVGLADRKSTRLNSSHM